MRVCALALMLALAFPATGYATGSVPGSRYTSGRAAGMADAFLPLADDGMGALFYNPAAIGVLKKLHFEPLNFQLQANDGFAKTIGTSSTKVTSLSGYKATLIENPNILSGAGTGYFPSFYSRGFALGLLSEARWAGMYRFFTDEIRYRTSVKLIPAAGFSIRLARGIVRLGYVFQWVHKLEGDVDVPSASASSYYDGLTKGSAFSHNAGFALTLPYRFLPALNLVARNIGSTSYKSSSLIPMGTNTTTPETEPMTIDASLSFQPKIGGGGYINWVVEGKDLLARSGLPIMSRVASGIELSIKDQFFIRGGYGSGYPAGGLGLKRKHAEFSLGAYSEEIGTGFHDERDFRLIFQYQVRMF